VRELFLPVEREEGNDDRMYKKQEINVWERRKADNNMKEIQERKKEVIILHKVWWAI
jgi:hypothetical protein